MTSKQSTIVTTTDTGHMIKNEIKHLEQDIKQNEQILTWLNRLGRPLKRRKRDLGTGFGNGPPIYNRRMPNQMGQNWPPVLQQPVIPRYFILI